MHFEKNRHWLAQLSKANEIREGAPGFIGSGHRDWDGEIPTPEPDHELLQYMWQMLGNAGELKPAVETHALIDYPNSQDYEDIVVPGCGVLPWNIQYRRDLYAGFDQLMVETRTLLWDANPSPGWLAGTTLDRPWQEGWDWGLYSRPNDLMLTKQHALETACLGLWKILKATGTSFPFARQSIAKYHELAQHGRNLPFRFGPGIRARSWLYVDELRTTMESGGSRVKIPVTWIAGLDTCLAHPELLFRQYNVDIWVSLNHQYYSPETVALACFYYLLCLYHVQRPSFSINGWGQGFVSADDPVYLEPPCGIEWTPLSQVVTSPVNEPGVNDDLLIHALPWRTCVHNQYGVVKSLTDSTEGWLLSSGFNIHAAAPPDFMPMAGNHAGGAFTDETTQRYCQELMRAGMNNNVNSQVQQMCQLQWANPENQACVQPPDPPQQCS